VNRLPGHRHAPARKLLASTPSVSSTRDITLVTAPSEHRVPPSKPADWSKPKVLEAPWASETVSPSLCRGFVVAAQPNIATATTSAVSAVSCQARARPARERSPPCGSLPTRLYGSRATEFRDLQWVSTDPQRSGGRLLSQAVPDLGNYDLVAALRKSGCPLCRVLAEGEVRAMDAFVHERGQAAEALGVFCERGGFCRSHAWLFHRRAALALTGVPVAQAYEALVRKDIEQLERLALKLPPARKLRRVRRTFLGRRDCPACERRKARLDAKGVAFVEALGESAVRDADRESDGLCVQHLDLVGAEALASNSGVAGFLIQELRRRLEMLEERLAAYERARDYRYLGESTDAGTDAWTDVVRSYVGDQYADEP
jgi:hypothetical protein